MKVLRLITVSVLVSFASFAHAEDVQTVPALLADQKMNFTYFGHRSFYSCSYAEAQTKQVLKSLGAENVKVSCSGGLESRSEYVSVYARFTALRETTSEKSVRIATLTPVRLKFNESCSLNEMIVDSALKKFEVYSKKSSSTCFDSEGRLSYDVVVLR